MNRRRIIQGIIVGLAVTLAAGTLSADRVWFDGSRDNGNTPPGMLLSDNEGYWGEAVHTGVTYQYESAPDGVADQYEGKAKSKQGKTNIKLIGGMLYSPLSGELANTLGRPVTMQGKPLAVVFDFQRIYRFVELDLCGADDRPMDILIQTRSGDQEPWTTAKKLSAPRARLVRVVFDSPIEARYIRAVATQETSTALTQVLAWGNPVGDAQPASAPANETLCSLRGADKTAFTPAQFREWQKSLGGLARQSVVWSRVNTWDHISNAPLLPAAGNRITADVEMTTPRNGDDALAIAATNTDMDHARRIRVEVGDIYRDGKPVEGNTITVRLGVFGVVPSRYGNVLSPIFYPDNMPGIATLEQYVLNAQSIRSYPAIELSNGGSAVLWLTAETRGAEPGLYTAKIHVDNGADFTLRVNVLNVTLPDTFHYLNAWSTPTRMFPFEYDDRIDSELEFMYQQGINVWHHLPTPGSVEARALKLAGTRKTFYHTFILPSEYVGRGWSRSLKVEELQEADYQKIREFIEGVVNQTRQLGLTTNQWVAELWDEPSRPSMAAFARLARFVHEVNPAIRVYANPSFWEENGQLRDQDLAFDSLTGWYDQSVDVSIPALLAAQWYPRCGPLFGAKRFINGAYQTTTQLSKNEARFEVERYRMAAWDAFSRGWNGWAVFAYYRPMGHPWNALSEDDQGHEEFSDYQMVFPGPRGPIPMRPLEGLRLGWQDYRLLSLLREQNKQHALGQILSDYSSFKATMPELRARALRAAAQP